MLFRRLLSFALFCPVCAPATDTRSDRCVQRHRAGDKEFESFFFDLRMGKKIVEVELQLCRRKLPRPRSLPLRAILIEFVRNQQATTVF